MCKDKQQIQMNIAWDLDDTVVKSEANPSIIYNDSSPYLNPALVGYEDKIKVIITGRHMSLYYDTIELMDAIGIYPDVVLINPEVNFSQSHIARIKSCYMQMYNIDVYVEDNAKYRDVMREYTDSKIMSPESVVSLYKSGLLL